MSALIVANRYAKSLLSLAVERNELPEVKKDIDGLSAAFAASKDLVQLLRSPIIKPEKKLSILHTIFDGKLTKITQSFMDIVVRKRREAYLLEMTDAFQNLYRQREGIVLANLETATAIDAALIAKVTDIVKANTGAQKVEISTTQNPKLIGGFVLEFDNKRYDASIVNKLAELRKEFSHN
ncbi:MAG: ATP synthase F1 subunit delta [Chitinophagales bacterium]|nr:ATP synthase F1 subunit delta [Bacteroidota bacterium]MCB9043204.1 ATP synthase F1 subunit delta [Chitinophagales bacterium]